MDKNAFFKIGYGLYVVSTNDGAKDNGMINNTFMQITNEPYEVVVAVNKANYTRELIQKTKAFNVSVLSEDVTFGRTADKFDGFESCFKMQNGIYALNNRFSNAVFACRVKGETDFSTHTLFIAEVTDSVLLSDKSTCTYDYYQKNVKPKPQPQTAGKTVWRCKICGYEYVGETLPADFICPLCKHPASDFEKVIV